jgi:hypothetical protein
VNDVMFSYRSFFSREVLGKRRGLSIFCGASLSLSRMRRRINPFNNSLPLLSFLFDGYILFTITFIVL